MLWPELCPPKRDTYQYLRPYLEIRVQGKGVIKLKLGRALIQHDWCYYKKGNLDTRHRYTQREADVKTLGGYHVKMEDWVMRLQATAHLAEQQKLGRGQEGSSLQVSEYGPPDTLLLTPSFQNGGKTNTSIDK